ncbi:MAG: hypothetical protein NVSMB18_32820 [Acetobacteraceae bacterium]
MLVRLLLLLLLPVMAHAQPKTVEEYPWTRVPAPELDKFEVRLGDLRVNNLAFEQASRSAPAGAATIHEFSASVANRSKADRHVLVQVIGIKADATPSLSSDVNVDVENRHSETVRSSLMIPEHAIGDTTAYYIRVLSTPQD